MPYSSETWMRPYLYEDIMTHHRTYLEGTIANTISQRFGQWWWNLYGGSERVGLDACPELFYERSEHKALAIIYTTFIKRHPF